MTTTRLKFTDGPDSYKAKDLSDYVLSFLGGDDLLTVSVAGKITSTMGDGKDTVTFGKAGATVAIDGGAGDDVFNGRHLLQDGIVRGGDGADRFNDFVNLDGHTLVMSGGAGDDTYRLDPLHPATIRELAGEGTDLVQIAQGMSYTMPANVENLQVLPFATLAGPARIYGNALGNQMTGSAAGETMLGGAGNDRIDGKAGDDVLWGGAGNDYLTGGTGQNVVHGGAGNDVLFSQGGNDVLIGGTGDDIYDVQYSTYKVVEDPGGGIDTLGNYKGGVVLPDNVENGWGAAETGCGVFGNDLDNNLSAYSFADLNYLSGYGGNDTLSSNYDAIANGGTGADHFTGWGYWTYVYTDAADSTPTSRDIYNGFDPQSDMIDLSAVDANAALAGQQHFTLVDAATGHAGELWLVNETVGGVASTWVRGDVNGDQVPDFELLIPAAISDTNLTL